MTVDILKNVDKGDKILSWYTEGKFSFCDLYNHLDSNIRNNQHETNTI